MFGSIWLTATAGAPLTEFATTLGADARVFGLIAAAPFAASLLSLPASFLIERLGRKPVFLVGLLVQRLLWVAIAVLPAIFYRAGQGKVALVVFVLLLLVMHAGQAVGGPGWMAWMADLIPRRVRGAYFAKRRQIGCLAALPTALVVGFVMDRLATSPEATLWTCGAIFLVAAAAGVWDILLFVKIPEQRADDAPKLPGLGTLTVPLRDRQFLVFALFGATVVMTAAPAGQFITLYLLDELLIGPFWVQGLLLVVPNLMMLATVGFWGRFVDRMGKRPAMLIGCCGISLSVLGFALVGHVPGGTAGTIVMTAAAVGLGAMFWGAIETANFNYLLEFAARRKGEATAGSGYSAVYGVVSNVAGIAGGLGFGLLLGAFEEVTFALPGDLAGRPAGGYEVLFVVAAGLRLSGLIWLALLRDTRARPTREAARFVTVNVYNNVQSAILAPARLGRLVVRDTFRRR